MKELPYQRELNEINSRINNLEKALLTSNFHINEKFEQVEDRLEKIENRLKNLFENFNMLVASDKE